MPAKLNTRFQFALIALFATTLVLPWQRLHAQTAASAATAPATPPLPTIPLSHLYLHFFLYEAHLEHLADANSVKPVNGAQLKDHLRRRIGLSTNEWQAVSASSLRMETSIQARKTKVHDLLLEDRKACQTALIKCPPTPPSLPQVRQIEREEDRKIDEEVKSLETSLGTDSTAKLHAYLQNDLATHVRVITLTPAQIQAARQGGKVAIQ